MTSTNFGRAARTPGKGRVRALLASLTLVAASALALSPALVSAGEQQDCGVGPIDLVLILDRSGSMNTNQGEKTRIGWARQAATQLVDGLDAAGGVGDGGLHRVGVVTFSDSASQVRALSGNFDAATIDASINAISASGFTAFKQGMAAGMTNMGGGRDFQDGVAVTHVYVLLSDGNPNPNSNTPNASEIAAYLGSADTAYAVAIGEDGGDLDSSGGTGVSYSFMTSVSNPTSAFRAVTNAADLPDLFSGILDEITCPAINVEKTADPTELPAGGGDVTYTYEVTNTVDGAPLSNVTVTDDKCSPVEYVSGDDGDNLLQFGETWVYTCSATLTETTTNVATAQGTFDGQTFTDRDEATVTVADEAPSEEPAPSEEAAPSEEPAPSEEAIPSETPREDTEGGNPTPSQPDLPDTSAALVADASAPALPVTLLALGLVLSLGALALATALSRDDRR